MLTVHSVVGTEITKQCESVLEQCDLAVHWIYQTLIATYAAVPMQHAGISGKAYIETESHGDNGHYTNKTICTDGQVSQGTATVTPIYASYQI